MSNKITVDFSDLKGEFLTKMTIVGDENDFSFLKEGRKYEYELNSEDYSLCFDNRIISHSRIVKEKEHGRIEPGNYVGLLKLELLDKSTKTKVSECCLDVHSTKLNYALEYRAMLENIADRCADFLLQIDSPVEQGFDPRDEVDEPTLAQRLYFLKNLLGSEDFQQAVYRIVAMPNTRWRDAFRTLNISRSGRLKRYETKQLAKGKKRVDLPNNHSLKYLMQTAPEEIEIRDKRDTVDTPENRFVKHALSVFLQTLEEMVWKFKELNSGQYPKLENEIEEVINTLEETLAHALFKEISILSFFPFNSPVLQRKEGYRQVLRSWMLFDLAAKLSWNGGDDVYAGGKRDAAALYEYWAFFRLLDLIAAVFELDKPPVEDLINANDLVLKLKAGKRMPIKGFYNHGGRRLRVEFSYNRTFSTAPFYPSGGSWTRQMRPDYTLSLWPAEF